MNILKNKRADLMSIWWFFILVIIGTGIVVGVFMFHSQKIDVRTSEAQIMAERVVNCLSLEGVILDEAFSKDINLLDFCGLNSKIIDGKSNYLLKISVIDSSDKISNSFQYGNAGLEENCKIAQALQKANDFPECYSLNVGVVDSKMNNFKLNILAGSRSEGK